MHPAYRTPLKIAISVASFALAALFISHLHSSSREDLEYTQADAIAGRYEQAGWVDNEIYKEAYKGNTIAFMSTYHPMGLVIPLGFAMFVTVMCFYGLQINDRMEKMQAWFITPVDWSVIAQCPFRKHNIKLGITFALIVLAAFVVRLEYLNLPNTVVNIDYAYGGVITAFDKPGDWMSETINSGWGSFDGTAEELYEKQPGWFMFVYASWKVFRPFLVVTYIAGCIFLGFEQAHRFYLQYFFTIIIGICFFLGAWYAYHVILGMLRALFRGG